MTITQIAGLGDRLNDFFVTLYPDHHPAALVGRLEKVLETHLAQTLEQLPLWDQATILMITYGDSLRQEKGQNPLKPLQTLLLFLQERLQGVISGVHLLPFFPYSSDDGFAVIDYRQVNPHLGTWEDIEAIAQNFEVMADLVINHVSSESEWFQQFLAQEKPGCDYFITVPPDTDLQLVVRPRSSPLLSKFTTTKGDHYVWTTFSRDQIDVNFANPDVLFEFIDILLGYCQHGVRFIRLDAVGFLWKKSQTACIHLRETHLVIQLIREILALTYPRTVLITETNVPNRENLSYFGKGNEAHMIYNFSLPPLLLNALIRGESRHLKTWMKSMPPAQDGCAYFNFTASHDGIGLRPAEGLLEGSEFEQLIDTMENFGAKVSYRSLPDGTEKPYELNISLFDALQGTIAGPDQWQRQRFLCSQAIMMALEGVPAFYIHSLLATPNDHARVEATQHNRSINRHQWDYDQLEGKLADPDSDQAWVLRELTKLIQIRRLQSAFHPNATQYTLDFQSPAIFGFWRQSRDRRQSIFCLFNLGDRPSTIPVSSLNLICTDQWQDLLGKVVLEEGAIEITLAPYQTAWITNVPLLH
ncbi:sugar phosphorylase [Picosynechococcus sp. NKBG15041c]|uniref:sugar phosphorylase n=1 Tax=Picosynechococcus sp. NKBG15041c TaxID=1407650 RepID=UPI0004646D78|nr:sugar phosphorylase [Picosynechococcus sp. NKBG15041c]